MPGVVAPIGPGTDVRIGARGSCGTQRTGWRATRCCCAVCRPIIALLTFFDDAASATRRSGSDGYEPGVPTQRDGRDGSIDAGVYDRHAARETIPEPALIHHIDETLIVRNREACGSGTNG